MERIKGILFCLLNLLFFVSMLIFMLLFTATFISAPFVLLSLSVGDFDTVYMLIKYLLIFAEISLVWSSNKGNDFSWSRII